MALTINSATPPFCKPPYPTPEATIMPPSPRTTKTTMARIRFAVSSTKRKFAQPPEPASNQVLRRKKASAIAASARMRPHA